jgi:hypothetical protein
MINTVCYIRLYICYVTVTYVYNEINYLTLFYMTSKITLLHGHGPFYLLVTNTLS